VTWPGSGRPWIPLLRSSPFPNRSVNRKARKGRRREKKERRRERQCSGSRRPDSSVRCPTRAAERGKQEEGEGKSGRAPSRRRYAHRRRALVGERAEQHISDGSGSGEHGASGRVESSAMAAPSDVRGSSESAAPAQQRQGRDAPLQASAAAAPCCELLRCCSSSGSFSARAP
jgi:hypothetical protein